MIIAQHWFKLELFLWFLGLNSEVHFCFLFTNVLLDPTFLEIILSISFSIPICQNAGGLNNQKDISENDSIA